MSSAIAVADRSFEGRTREALDLARLLTTIDALLTAES